MTINLDFVTPFIRNSNEADLRTLIYMYIDKLGRTTSIFDKGGFLIEFFDA
ncbi:hypothetical protein [Brumimicrobium oceani]|uniref:hypothetical protein n=1 Tax=Brumimicrobium oceani TaxID=2100725 RepID=UPI001304B268|nr:hypothetical protein [Brumimicrobium oceani]